MSIKTVPLKISMWTDRRSSNISNCSALIGQWQNLLLKLNVPRWCHNVAYVCICAEGGHSGTICSLYMLLRSKAETLFGNKTSWNQNHMARSVGHTLHRIAMKLLLNWGTGAHATLVLDIAHFHLYQEAEMKNRLGFMAGGLWRSRALWNRSL